MHLPTLAQSNSHIHDWLIAGGAIVILAVAAMIAYVATLNLRLAKRITAITTSTGAVPHIMRKMQLAAQAFSVFAILLPLIVLIGWTMGNAHLVSLLPGMVAMNPVVACCLIILGTSLWLVMRGSPQAQRVAKIAALLIALVALIKLAGWLIGRDTLIDQFLFHGRLELVPGLPANRMAPNSAVALLLLGIAISTIDVNLHRGRRPAEYLAIFAALIALLAMVGYLYSVTALYHVKTFIPMALHTSAVVSLLALGILFARPDVGLMCIVTSDTTGGMTARRLLPATILVPVALGWLRVVGQRAGASDVDFGVSLVILGDVLFFMMLVWSTAGLLRRADVHRQQTQAALAGERTLLRGLIDNLPDHIFIKDAQGKYITDNISHARFVGLTTPEQVIGKTVGDFFPPDVAAKFAADDAAVVNSGQPLVSRVEVITEHDGSRRWVSTTKVPVRNSDNITTGLVCISRDISEQVRADELLREQYEKLQALAKSERDAHETLKRAQSRMVQSEKLAGLGQLVAGVAHEINNPLSFVNNNVAVLQRDVGAIAKLLKMYRQADPLVQAGNAELMSQIRDLCEAIDIDYTLTSIDELNMRSREGLKRIQQIVKDLRDFARLDESDLHEVDLNQGVESTVNIIRGRAKSKQVTLELDLHPLPPVACFPAKINQVIMNLVANAIDACGDGGKVVISTNARDNGDGARIDVIDTGSGIPPAVRERIFDPFFTTKRQGEGTGLGLSISYGIVQDHGGTIEVDSKEGEGSRFTITLPLRPSVPRERQTRSI